jgi:hypothetical protein
MNKLQLSFHTTFPLRKQEVARLLSLAARPEGLPVSTQELVAETGFGTKKVGPVKSWATRSGLIAGNLLTEEGRVIFEADPFLRSQTAEWFMHFNLSFGSMGFAKPPSHAAQWGGWTYFIFDFLPNYREFSLDTLVRTSESVFGDPPRLIRSNFPYVLRAYTDRDALGACGILEHDSTGVFKAGEAPLPKVELIGYILTKLWARDFGVTESVLTDTVLSHPVGLGPLLGTSRSTLEHVIDLLSGEGYLEQRRAVAPYQLVRRWTNPLELLKKALR